MKQDHVLRDQTDRVPQAGLGHPGDVLPIDADRAALHIVKAHQQGDQRGLPGAGVPDQADPLAGLDGQAQLLEHRSGTIVGKGTPVEGDLPAARPECPPRRPVANFTRHDQHASESRMLPIVS